ncbi:MAG: class II fructose-bisphosphate aldolase [Oscillospiraceae bacterium]|jgi:fructose-bisphosphate aldolase class II|nr:class II fructose-bisphosphate aldolase [Oscillospiraceae bacterium]
MNAIDVIKKAQANKTIVPAFNIPYLPMVKPVIEAICDEDCVAMVQVARLEWEKFESKSLEAVAEEYFKYYDPDFTLLHLDHVPAIDEDLQTVDVIPIIERALDAGYQSVMVDGSRLSLKDNISLTQEVSALSHSKGVAVEAELGAVAGHEKDGIGMSYEELFRTRKGFTKPEEAKQFAKQSGCDWLSVAVGSIHGSIAEGIRDQKKPEARLDIEHIAKLKDATNNMPLVLHGGTGISQSYILDAVQNGIAKINIATDIRQPYEAAMKEYGDIELAREQVYLKTRWVIHDFLKITGNRNLIG